MGFGRWCKGCRRWKLGSLENGIQLGPERVTSVRQVVGTSLSVQRLILKICCVTLKWTVGDSPMRFQRHLLSYVYLSGELDL